METLAIILGLMKLTASAAQLARDEYIKMRTKLVQTGEMTQAQADEFDRESEAMFASWKQPPP